MIPWSSFLGKWTRYGQSELATLIYAREFARHHPDIVSVAVHPGTAVTGLVGNLPWTHRWFVYATTVGTRLSPAQCAWNQQRAATCPRERLESGRFYEPMGRKGRMVRRAGDDELAARL